MFATTADVAALRAPAHAPVARRNAVATVAKESRIGKQPVKVPKGVTVKVEGQKVSAKVRRHARASPPRLARRPRMPAFAAAITARCAAFRAGPPPGCAPRRFPAAITARDRGKWRLCRALLRVSATALTHFLFSSCRRVRRGSCRPALTTACRSSWCGSCSSCRAQRRSKRRLTRWAARRALGVLTRRPRAQEADGSLRFRRKDETKKAYQLHGLSRCVAPLQRCASPGSGLASHPRFCR
jgi:hypothetical protein